MLQDTEDKRKEKRKQKVQKVFGFYYFGHILFHFVYQIESPGHNSKYIA